MAFDIFNTNNLLMAVKQLTPPTTFLRDRYFPTNPATDIFSTDDVLVQYKEGNKKLAPFVAPRKGGVTMLRSGFTMERYTPPFVAPRRTLTIDDLKKKGFGESLLTSMTPEQRQLSMVLQDVEELDELITRREEAMAAETMLTNGCIMKHIADDISEADEMEIRFYNESSNPSVYTPSTKWGQAGAKIIDDIHLMIKMLTSRGLAANDLLVAQDVASIIINDDTIQKLLDTKNVNIGGVDPMLLPNGVARIARLNIYGRMVDILCYEESYEDDKGKTKQFIPNGNVVLTAPNAGRKIHGAVSQVEQADGEVHTYTGTRIPKYISDANGNTRTITLTSCPLLIPNHKNPWVAAKVTE